MRLFRRLSEWFSFRWPFNRQQQYNRDWPWSRRQRYTRDMYTTPHMYNSPHVEMTYREINGQSYGLEPPVGKMLNVVLPSSCRAVTLTWVMDMEEEPERRGERKKKKARAIDHPQPYTQSWMETRDIQDLQSEGENWPEQTVKRKKQKKRNTEPQVDKTLAQEETEIDREHKRQGKRKKKKVRETDHPQHYTQYWMDTSDIQDLQSEDENWPEQTVKRKKQKKVRTNEDPQPYTQSWMDTSDIQDLQSEDENWPEQTVKRKKQKKVRANEDPQPYTQSWMDTSNIQDLQSEDENWPEQTVKRKKQKKVRANDHPQPYTQSRIDTDYIQDLQSEDENWPEQTVKRKKQKKVRANDHPQPYTQSWIDTDYIQDLQSEDENWPEQTVKRKKQKKRNTEPQEEKTLVEMIEREHKRQGERNKKKVRANEDPQPYTQSWMETRDIQDLQSEDENWPEQTVKRKKQKKRNTEPQVDKTLVETKKKVRINDHPQHYTQSRMDTDIQDLETEEESRPQQTVKGSILKQRSTEPLVEDILEELLKPYSLR